MTDYLGQLNSAYQQIVKLEQELAACKEQLATFEARSEEAFKNAMAFRSRCTEELTIASGGTRLARPWARRRLVSELSRNPGPMPPGRRRRSFESWAFDFLGSSWGGNSNAPGCNIDGRIGDCYVVSTRNDGFELFIGYEHEWCVHFRFNEAMLLVRFIVWNWWIKGMGCGLRRWAWYKLLSRRVAGYERDLKSREALASAAGESAND